MTPTEVVMEQFKIPFAPRPYQEERLIEHAEKDRAGLYWEPGTGKTLGSTVLALYHTLTKDIEQWLVVVPPILIPQWAGWLSRTIDLASGKPLQVVEYCGTPKKRNALSLDSDFIVTTYGLLKNDFERFMNNAQRYNLGIICDEATAIKNIETDNHKAVATLAEGRILIVLTGTPINKPSDAYGYIKLLAPGTYRNKRQFERLHIAEKDEYDKVVEWANLDLLADNMRINTTRVIRREVISEIPQVVYTPIRYRLEPDHMALYNQIAADRLVEFENGKQIDAISAQSLRYALQQVIVNWADFDEDPNRRPAVLDLIDEVMDEIEGEKLVVVGNYRRTNRLLQEVLHKKYGAVAVYGDVSPAQKQMAIRSFIEDPSCRIIILHPESAGFGVDGLQHVCHDMLFVEAPTTPTPFTQVVARLDRDGQNDVVHVRVAVAIGTVQVGMFRSLLDNDELAMSVQGGYKSLKDSIYGE